MIIVAFWMALSITGLVYSALGFREAMRDWRALGQITNGRRRIARDAVALQALLTAKQIMWLSLGVVSVVSGQAANASLSGFALFLIAANAITATMAAILYYGARYLLRSSQAKLNRKEIA